MPKLKYQEVNFRRSSLEVIDQANAIVEEYSAQGFDLTLRQLYYQFVARDMLANKEENYKRLGSIVNDARLAGLIDWDAIADRTRFLRGNTQWDDPTAMIEAQAEEFRIDKWKTQDRRVEVWIEKDALVGILENVCPELDVDFFSCRGYTSASAMWRAAIRLLGYLKKGQEPLILHLGDHDPSGIDMSRDIEDRLEMFLSAHGYSGEVEFSRIALTMRQIEDYEPPPNPAKVTDSRFNGYRDRYGTESWELDALDPATLGALIRQEVQNVRLDGPWTDAVELENEMKEKLETVASRWAELDEFLA